MVHILMASYNGEKYIKQQIDSILSQTYKDIKLIIQDDNSKDETMEILKKYETNFPDKIKIIQNEYPSGSAKNNFIKLLENNKDKDYVMLSDQDDVWKIDKVELAVNKMKVMEQKYGKNMPCLVHTDLSVVDENLKLIAESMQSYQHLNGAQNSLNKFLVQNSVTGCTVCINKALINLIKPTGKDMIMHDGYLGLLAAAFGKINYITKATILYRQHGQNQVGAKNSNSITYKINKLVALKENRKSIELTYQQADTFLNMYKNKLSKEQIKLLEEYIDIPNQNKVKRCLTIIKLGTLKNGISRRLGQFLFI